MLWSLWYIYKCWKEAFLLQSSVFIWKVINNVNVKGSWWHISKPSHQLEATEMSRTLSACWVGTWVSPLFLTGWLKATARVPSEGGQVCPFDSQLETGSLSPFCAPMVLCRSPRQLGEGRAFSCSEELKGKDKMGIKRFILGQAS